MPTLADRPGADPGGRANVFLGLLKAGRACENPFLISRNQIRFHTVAYSAAPKLAKTPQKCANLTKRRACGSVKSFFDFTQQEVNFFDQAQKTPKIRKNRAKPRESQRVKT